MLGRTAQLGKRKDPRFAAPPWDANHPRWQELDRELESGHVAREVVAAMELLDWSDLYACYSASGSPATNPLLMLRIVLIELRRGRFRPQHWYQDTRENEALKWAGFGICPSRTAWYAFHDRLAPHLETWNSNLVALSIAAKVTDGSEGSLDGSTIEANASRHRLINQEKLSRRQEQLAAACAADACLQPVADPPAWMATTPGTRLEQSLRFGRAQQRLDDLLVLNSRQDKRRRREAKKIVTSTSDTEAAMGRDKFHVFRPLYNVQLVRDVNSPLILTYDVLAQPTDAGTLKPMLGKLQAIPGLNLQMLLVDAGYVTASHLALCDAAGVTLIGPWQQNDYSRAKQAKSSKQKLFGKEQFTWQPDEEVYLCPQGRQLHWIGQQKRPQADGEINVMHSYRCSPKDCGACPLNKQCTINPMRGRSVKRSEHEDLIEAHRRWMETEEAKQLYKKRKQTVELGFADVKQHRGLRRFPRRGLQRARAHVGLLVLVNNLLVYRDARLAQEPENRPQSQAA